MTILAWLVKRISCHTSKTSYNRKNWYCKVKRLLLSDLDDISISYRYSAAKEEYKSKISFTVFSNPSTDFLDYIGLKKLPGMLFIYLPIESYLDKDFNRVERYIYNSVISHSKLEEFIKYVSWQGNRSFVGWLVLKNWYRELPNCWDNCRQTKETYENWASRNIYQVSVGVANGLGDTRHGAVT